MTTCPCEVVRRLEAPAPPRRVRPARRRRLLDGRDVSLSAFFVSRPVLVGYRYLGR